MLDKRIFGCLTLCACVIYILYETSIFLTVKATVNNNSKNKRKLTAEVNVMARRNSHTKLIILISKARSGSSITAKLVSHNIGFYYTYEPVNLAKQANYSVEQSDGILEFLRKIHQCRLFNDNSTYNSLRIKNGWNEYSYSYQDLCYKYVTDKHKLNCVMMNVSIDRVLCETAKTHLIKTIYVKLKHCEEILKSKELDVVVLYLVRDPRGTLASRHQVLANYPHLKFDVNATELCSEIFEDLYYSNLFRKKYPSRFVQVAYEEVAMNSSKTFRQIYKFLGLKYTAQIEYFMRSQMHILNEPKYLDEFSTVRNARSRPYHWQEVMSFAMNLEIQEQCKEVLQSLDYKVFESLYDYMNISNYIHM